MEKEALGLMIFYTWWLIQLINLILLTPFVKYFHFMMMIKLGFCLLKMWEELQMILGKILVRNNYNRCLPKLIEIEMGMCQLSSFTLLSLEQNDWSNLTIFNIDLFYKLSWTSSKNKLEKLWSVSNVINFKLKLYHLI